MANGDNVWRDELIHDLPHIHKAKCTA